MKWFKKFLLLLVLLVGSGYGFYYYMGTQDFPRICRVVTDYTDSQEYLNIDAAQRVMILSQKIDASIWSPATKQIFQTMGALNREQRFQVFMSAAHKATGKPWRCPAFEKLMRGE